MASLVKVKSGAYRINITQDGGERTYVWLGKMKGKNPARLAERIISEVNTIQSCNAGGVSLPPETNNWLGSISDELHSKLVKAGLINARQRQTLGKFIETFKAGRKWNDGSKKAFVSSEKHLIEFFGADTPLEKITANLAADFRTMLMNTGLATATSARRLGQVKTVFNEAKRRSLISISPFENVESCSSQVNTERRHFVTVAETNQLLDACNSASQRLIIVLARYGGLRTPSELKPLKWSEIDWSKKRFVVHSPKTEHQGKPYRIVPLFPEIESALTELWSTLPEGASDTVFAKLPACLGTFIRSTIRRAGLVWFDKPFQNMRSTRATELVNQFPPHLVNALMGHTEQVAMQHYRQRFC